MTKRAAIYIRVSSEQQSRQVSPQSQEADCRDYCARKGYHVTDVYRDVERYRVGRKLVEPSGTRADRPQLRQMLADADAGRFDVIVAWREDRLYRAFRPMLDVLDCVERKGLAVELTNDSFDSRFAPIKAWAAKMELDAKHERFVMGVAGRYERGQDWNGQVLFGYRRMDGLYFVEEEEAELVRMAFRMFAEGRRVRDIRRMLVDSGVKQCPGKANQPKRAWANKRIYRMLKTDAYHTGLGERVWGGETYQVVFPKIVDSETAARVAERFARYKEYPAGNRKAEALGAGLIFCAACGLRMQVVSDTRRGDYVYYRCPCRYLNGDIPAGCARSVRINRIDADIWRKVWEVISVPGKLEALIEARIAALRDQEQDAEREIDRLNERLGALAMERQKVITGWRKGKMSEQDYDTQMAAMNCEQADLEGQLSKARLAAGGQSLRLAEFGQWYRRQAAAGLQALNEPPINAEDHQRQFALKRKFVDMIVHRVDVAGDKSVTVTAEFDLSGFLGVSPAATCPATCRSAA